MTRRLANPKQQVQAPAEQTDAFQPDAIYLDTNPILGAGWPTPSAQILEVMSRAEKLGIQLCLPEVVQQELEQHWLRELSEEWKNTNTTIARLNKKGHSLVSYDRAAPLRSADDLLNAVRSRTREFAQRYRTVPLTGRPLAEFVAMAVRRKAAFEDGGYGFQDSVILCSVLEDMKARGITSGVLVTNDKAFRSEGAVALVSAAGVTLRVVSDLDELDKLVRGLFEDRILESLEQERATLIAAFRERIAEVEKFLMDNFSVTASDLKIYGTLKKIDGLRVLGIENAHEGGFGFDEKPEGEGRVTLSADVRIALTLDIQHYEPQPQPRLKVGGEIPPAPLDPLSTFFGAALRLESNSKEVVAVVKADATKTETGYTDFRFTGVYMKSDDAGFGSLFASRRT